MNTNQPASAGGCNREAAPRRVMHVCQRDDPATGGAARVAVELVKRMPSHGIESWCVFVYGGLGALSEGLREQTRWLGIDSSRQSLLGMWRLWRLIRRLKPDVIHHHDGLSWTHLVSWCFPRTLVFGHGHLDGPQEGAPWRRQLAHRIHARTYDYLLAVSEWTRDAWLRLGYPVERAKVLANGVDGNKFQPATAEEKSSARLAFGLPDTVKVLVSVGRLHCGMKGTDDFLRVLSCLPAEWHGLVAGTGPDLEQLQVLAGELNLEERIHFAGLVDPVTKVYHAADLLAVTSHYEPFGLMAVEAMACGLPVVGFECRGGVVDVIRSGEGVLISDRNLQAMADAILLESGRAASEVRRQRVLALYDWSNSAARLACWVRELPAK